MGSNIGKGMSVSREGRPSVSRKRRQSVSKEGSPSAPTERRRSVTREGRQSVSRKFNKPPETIAYSYLNHLGEMKESSFKKVFTDYKCNLCSNNMKNAIGYIDGNRNGNQYSNIYICPICMLNKVQNTYGHHHNKLFYYIHNVQHM
jgi:hypothetical protein